MVSPGEILHQQIAGQIKANREVMAIQSIEQQIAAMIDGADFSEITTKEFDAIKRCHYIVLKELRQLGLLAF